AYSALLNFDMARSACGRFLLRIENIDIERCRPEFEQAIYEDLGWLGLAWETPVRRQCEHFSNYASALARLAGQGLTYPCFCSRGEIICAVAGRTGWQRDPDGAPLYPGTCKNLTREEKQRRIGAGERAALRIDMEAAIAKAGRGLAWLEMGPSAQTREVAAEPSLWGDTTLARKDILASYHIAVVVDDALQGVTDVVRGEDLFQATSLHRLLQVLLDLPAPFYRHHGLLRDASGQKLSKSSRAKSLRALRQEGLSPAALQEKLLSDPVFAGGL
ncbi:MAG: tRNA glutamyl-Q(34) synthetase GluQRS, partial [Methylocella sp.]